MKRILWFCLFIINFSCKNNSKDNTVADTQQQQHSPQMNESISRGAELYNNFCASCHLAGGEGIQGVFPPLKQSNWLNTRQAEAIHAVKYGLRGPIEVNDVDYDNLMPALGLSNEEIADIMNYINNAWGNNYGKPLTQEDVAAIEK